MIAHRAPVPDDRLEQVLKVPWNPPNIMGEHTPLHACACLDHACRVRLFPRHLLVGLGVHHLPIFNATLLYLFVEGITVESHIGARWSFDGAVVKMISGNGATPSSHSVAQSVWNGTLFRKVSSHRAILAPARSSSRSLGPQFSRTV